MHGLLCTLSIMVREGMIIEPLIYVLKDPTNEID